MSKRSHRKKRRNKKQSSAERLPWMWAAGGMLVLLLVAGGLLAWRPWTSDAPQVTPQVEGAPRLEVDQTVVDEGYVKFNVPVRTTFELSNAGDQPLKILGEPAVELVEGC